MGQGWGVAAALPLPLPLTLRAGSACRCNDSAEQAAESDQELFFLLPSSEDATSTS